MEFKQGSFKLNLLLAVDREEDVHLLAGAIEQLLNNLNSLKLENDNAALLLEAFVELESMEEDEEA